LGLVRPVAGQVRVLGAAYRSRRRLVAYVPQRGSVDWDFPTTVLDVVLMGTYGGLGWFRRPGRAERERAPAALEKVGMAHLAGRPIRQLSGGQHQRGFLAPAPGQDARGYFIDAAFPGGGAPAARAP